MDTVQNQGWTRQGVRYQAWDHVDGKPQLWCDSSDPNEVAEAAKGRDCTFSKRVTWTVVTGESWSGIPGEE